MIEEIEIDGFRLLKGFKADLGPLTVVIGANASGKSSLFDCLQMIGSCCEYPLEIAYGQSLGSGYTLTADGQTTELRWQITFRKPATGYWSGMSLGREPLVYEAVLQPDMQGRIYPKYELLRNRNPADGYEQPLKFLEATPYRRQILNRKARRLISFDEVEESTSSDVKEPRDIDVAKTNPQSSLQELALLLSKMRFPNEYPIPTAARILLTRITIYPGFDVTHSSGLRTKAAEIKPETWLTPNGGNLGTVLHEILTRYDFKESADDLRDYLRSAFPTVEEISCETTFGTPPQLLVRLREKGASRPTEIWNLSDGMLRFLCLAAALLNPVPAPFIAIDEPELGLHPGLLPVVADMIKGAAERTQVLVSTHSPELLDCFNIDDIAVMARAEGEVKSVWHRPSSRKSLIRMLEKVAGDTLGNLHRSGELEAGA